MTTNVKDFIGLPHFEPGRDDMGRPVSIRKGVIAGFIVRRDDLSEYEVRSDETLASARVPLQHKDLVNLRIGDLVRSMSDDTQYSVLRVFPVYGDVWVKRLDDGKTSAKKATDLRRG